MARGGEHGLVVRAARVRDEAEAHARLRERGVPVVRPAASGHHPQSRDGRHGLLVEARDQPCPDDDNASIHGYARRYGCVHAT